MKVGDVVFIKYVELTGAIITEREATATVEQVADDCRSFFARCLKPIEGIGDGGWFLMSDRGRKWS